MFCPGCGKSEQTPDSYCRSCGEFFADPTKVTSLVSRLFGITDPERQLKFSLTIDLLTAIISASLIVFLMGYFEGAYQKTGATTPKIIYLVYAFLGIVSICELFSFTVGTAYRKKLAANKKKPVEKEVRQGNTQRSLSEADTKDFVRNSITDQTTRSLESVPRKRNE